MKTSQVVRPAVDAVRHFTGLSGRSDLIGSEAQRQVSDESALLFEHVVEFGRVAHGAEAAVQETLLTGGQRAWRYRVGEAVYA